MAETPEQIRQHNEFIERTVGHFPENETIQHRENALRILREEDEERRRIRELIQLQEEEEEERNQVQIEKDQIRIELQKQMKEKQVSRPIMPHDIDAIWRRMHNEKIVRSQEDADMQSKLDISSASRDEAGWSELEENDPNSFFNSYFGNHYNRPSSDLRELGPSGRGEISPFDLGEMDRPRTYSSDVGGYRKSKKNKKGKKSKKSRKNKK